MDALVSAELGSKLKLTAPGAASDYSGGWPQRMVRLGASKQAKGAIAMVHATTQRSPFNSSLLVAVTILLTAAIFSVDAFTTLGMAIAALYSVVILLSSRFLDRRGVLLVSMGCAGLTIAAYLLSHGLDVTGMPMLRFLVSLAAIGTTAFLALEDKAASFTLREHAGLLDLTRDGIFVRDMHDVITYWNRGAEEAYGWRAEQVVGKLPVMICCTRSSRRRSIASWPNCCKLAAGRASSCIPGPTEPVWWCRAGGRCCTIKSKGRLRSSKPTTTSPSASTTKTGFGEAEACCPKHND